MKVSAVICTYNRAAMLSERFKEIEAQTYGNWEIVVVNDGSSDNTSDVILSWKNKLKDRVIEINLSKNSGCECVPRAIGITHATGELIIHVDDDVIQLENKMEDLVKGLGDSILAYGKGQMKYLGEYPEPKLHDYPIPINKEGWPEVDDGMVLYRSDLYKAVPHFYGNFVDDFWQVHQFIRRVYKLKLGTFSFVPKVVMINVQHGGNWSDQPIKKYLTKQDFSYFNSFLKGDYKIEYFGDIINV